MVNVLSTADTRPDTERHVLVGKVLKAHGIKGELKILVYSGDPDDFSHFPRILLVDEHFSTSKEFEVEKSRPQAKGVIVKLAGLDDRTSAEILHGFEIWTEKDFLPALAEDEFYWHEVVGLRVETENGEKLGKVKKLFESGAADILVIRGTGREYLVPAMDEFIASIDYDNGLLVIKDVPGLLDINS